MFSRKYLTAVSLLWEANLSVEFSQTGIPVPVSGLGYWEYAVGFSRTGELVPVPGLLDLPEAQ